MLRTVVFGVGVVFVVASVLLLAAGFPPFGIWLGILGLLMAGGILVERVYYQRLAAARPGPGWNDTGERFVDPTSGQRVAVFHNPATGERRYVEDRG